MTFEPYKEQTRIPDKTFPINIFKTKLFYLHWHDHLEWVFVKKGKVRIQVDAMFDVVNEGELVFINSRQLHAGSPLVEGTEMVAIVFNEALLRNSGLDSTEARYIMPIISHRLPLPNILKSDAPLAGEIIASVSRLIMEMEAKKTGYELFVKSELYRIFGSFFRYHEEMVIPSKPLGKKSEDINALLQYIRGHYQSSITVEDAAKRTNMSPNHFCSVFKKVTGKTLIEYIHLLRVNEAERLLKETGMYMTEIAEKVGFGNTNYFGRVFKKYRNISPSELRKQYTI